MEALDRTAMVRAIYPALLEMKAAGRPQRDLLNVVVATAEGYAFPTNLDLDQPIGSLAPPSQVDTVLAALADDFTPEQLDVALRDHERSENPMTTIGVIGLGRIGAFHTDTLSGLDSIDDLVITDERPELVAAVAAKHGAKPADSVDELLSSGLDGVVVAAATPAHAELTLAAVERGIPTFCEKPIASTAAESPQGRRRRSRARACRFRSAISAASTPRSPRPSVPSTTVRSGLIHTVRSTTMDPAPPPMDYITGLGRHLPRLRGARLRHRCAGSPGSTAVEVYATGSVQGDPQFAEFGDVDTAAVVVRSIGGTLGVVSAARYNGRGYDCRLEVHGFDDTVVAGWDQGAPVRNVDPGNEFPDGPAAPLLHGPVHRGVPRRARRVRRRRQGRRRSRRCTVADAVEVAWLAEAATESLKRGVPVRLDGSEVADEDRRCADFLGRVRSTRLGLPAHARPGARRDARRRDVGDRAGPEGFLPSDPAQLTALLRRRTACAASASSPPSCCTTPTTIRSDDRPARWTRWWRRGADVLVLAAATGTDGYDARPTLDDRQWATLLANLDRLADAAADRGVLAVLHPHVGTMVETRDEVDRVLDGSSIRLCLDTGHLLIGGTDPLAAGHGRCPTASRTPTSRMSTRRSPPRCRRVS